MVAHTRGLKVLGVIVTLVFLGMQVGAWISSPPEERIFYGVGFGAFVLLGLILVAEAFVARVIYDDAFIYTRSPWRLPRRIPWSAVERCDYGEINQWYRIHAGRHGIVRLSKLMWGIGEFLERLPCPHPGYPPGNRFGPGMGGVSSTGEAVAVSTGPSKFFAGLGGVIALGALVIWAMYRMPVFEDFREIRGRVTELEVKKLNKGSSLRVRLDTCPTLLTLGSMTVDRGAWQELLGVVKKGEEMRVMVSAEEFERPKKALVAAEPQIWITGLWFQGKTYFSFADYVAWHRENRGGLLWVALLFGGLGTFVYWEMRRALKKQAAAAPIIPTEDLERVE